MAYTIFSPNTKAKSNEVNDNFAFISGSRLIGFNPGTGAAVSDFSIGDLSAIAGGSVAGDLLSRSGKSIRIYNPSGTQIGSITYDQLLNLQDATELQKGVAKIATQAQVDAGLDDSTIVTPLKLFNSPGGILQTVEQDFTTYLATNATIAFDDTKPLNSEGVSLITIPFTPKSATSTLYFDASCSVGQLAREMVALTLCNTVISECLRLSVDAVVDDINKMAAFPLQYSENAGSLTTRTYDLRVAGIGANQVRVNGTTNDNTRKFGGSLATVLRITEISN